MEVKRTTSPGIVEWTRRRKCSHIHFKTPIKKVFILITLGVAVQNSWATAPVYSWNNNLGHSGTGFGDQGSAYSAAIADSFANYSGTCTADPLGGSFPSWSAVLHGCADVRVNAYCPSNTQMNSQTQSCDLAGNAIDPNLAVGKPQICVGNPCDPGTGNKFQEEYDYQGGGYYPLRLVRYYNQLFPRQASLGPQWRHNYDKHIAYSTGAIHAYAHRADGKIVEFTLNQGSFISIGIVPATLIAMHDATGALIGWRYTSEDDETENYDAAGKLVSFAERGGATQTLVYDAKNRLTQVTDLSGRSLTFTYDNLNRITSVTDPSGGTLLYSYDAAGNLRTVTYPDTTPAIANDNPQKIYAYEDNRFPHALTGVIDENGSRFATWTYDANGRVSSSGHAGGAEKVALIYNSNGTTVNDFQNDPTIPSGSRIYGFQSILGASRNTSLSQTSPNGTISSTTFSYDANGNIASRTDFNGNLSCYAYNTARNLETVLLEGLAAGSSCPADLAAYTPAANGIERKISTQWHPSYRLPIQIDEAGRSISFSYDANGNLLNKTVTDTATQQSRSWSYTYNNLGQVLTEDGPRTDVNDITNYSYYADSTVDHKPGDLWKITNALGHVTTFTAFDGNGRLLSLTDPNGLVVGFAYDARGRLTQKTVDSNTTRYDYDPAGNLVKVTRPTGVFITYSYDAAHRLTDITDALGGKIHYTLDLMGNRTLEEIFDATGTVVKTQSRQFDALSRLQQDIDAYNQATSYQYDANGNLTKVTDANGHATQHTYDSLNRLIRSTDALNGLTDYQYDTQDRLTQVTDANNHSTIYSYNGLGDLTQLDSPNTGITQYSYDSAGNLKTKIDAANVSASYTYDSLNRLLGVDYPGTEADVANGYDGTALGLNGQIGRLTSARRGPIDTVQQFDLRGNLLFSEVSDYQYQSKSILSDTRYVYNADDQVSETQIRGELSSFTVSSFKNLYDGAGRVQEVQLSETGANGSTARVVAENIVHLPFGPVKSLDYGNGLSMSRSYDTDYRLAAETAGNVFTQSYRYDQAGNVISQSDGTGAAKQESYGYDELDRLASALGANLGYQSQNYGYDAVGNRTSLDVDTEHKAYQYDLSNQQLQNVTSGSSSIQYQSNSQGNILQIGSRSLHYAPDQRVSDITPSSNGSGRYYYDAFGRRIHKVSTLNNDMMSYDSNNRLLAEWGLLGATLRGYGNVSYAYLDGEPLARVDEPIDGDSQIRYYHNNHLGAPLKITDEQTQVIWSADYDPFGKATVTNTTITQNLRLPGQYYDAESGWHYNMQRYYDPGTGRYLQSDPIGLAGGINTYIYVFNNPVNLIDTDGRIPIIGIGLRLLAAFMPMIDLQMMAVDDVPGGSIGGACKIAKNATRFPNLAPTDAIGEALTFPASQIIKSSYSGKLNYIVSETGELVIGRSGHTSLSNGADVIAAGEAKFVNGALRSLDNASGHYQPSGLTAQDAAESAFQQAGFDSIGKYLERRF